MVSERFDQEFFADILRGLIPDLPATAASLLSRNCLLRRYDAGERIIREGEASNGIFLLILGTVQPSISSETEPRKQVTLRQVSAPAVLGVAGSMITQPSPFTLTALTEIEAAFIPQSQVGNILRDSPQAGLAFSQMLANELTSTYAHLEQLRCPEQAVSALSQLN